MALKTQPDSPQANSPRAGSSPPTTSANDAARRRRGRSWAIMIVLVGLVALFYAITIVKMTHN
jgi:hypothetical protein